MAQDDSGGLDAKFATEPSGGVVPELVGVLAMLLAPLRERGARLQSFDSHSIAVSYLCCNASLSSTAVIRLRSVLPLDFVVLTIRATVARSVGSSVRPSANISIFSASA